LWRSIDSWIFQTGCDQSFLKNIGKIKSRPVDWIKVQHSAVLS
jgi:hypothetical protein